MGCTNRYSSLRDLYTRNLFGKQFLRIENFCVLLRTFASAITKRHHTPIGDDLQNVQFKSGDFDATAKSPRHNEKKRWKKKEMSDAQTYINGRGRRNRGADG